LSRLKLKTTQSHVYSGIQLQVDSVTPNPLDSTSNLQVDSNQLIGVDVHVYVRWIKVKIHPTTFLLLLHCRRI